METKLEQTAVKARREPDLRFTSLAHHITSSVVRSSAVGDSWHPEGALLRLTRLRDRRMLGAQYPWRWMDWSTGSIQPSKLFFAASTV
ncbi:hypothetical protein ACVMIH_007612 [Bradyrhizobium sp. USDA 4503]